MDNFTKDEIKRQKDLMREMKVMESVKEIK
jgi:hypothetical protein